MTYFLTLFLALVCVTLRFDERKEGRRCKWPVSASRVAPKPRRQGSVRPTEREGQHLSRREVRPDLPVRVHGDRVHQVRAQLM